MPDDDVADRLEEVSLRLEGLGSLPRQPRAWLHLTVARLPQFDDLGQAELTRLCDRIGAALERVPAFELQVGDARLEPTSVTCTGAPSTGWDALVAAVRGAAAGFDDRPLPPAPHAPHVTLAYATGAVDDAGVEARLAGSGPIGTVPVSRVHLVSVTVRPEVGTFDWTELANWDLEG
ncbi:hypothetical protein G7085_17260 [Tessaracoccus sp. HDW20]|uniref:2'-5' RNA ligase family protein n=1 Tax=Tessaracoccus coleopterorum TaxID=2714950 RepID=UPI0018D46443|nr:2'-5' RNA ligase family protein [Tessaracoccus coleopterorum]NHB85740.1 hypothetical protein [Tessaracoccus coleopterorum]